MKYSLEVKLLEKKLFVFMMKNKRNKAAREQDSKSRKGEFSNRPFKGLKIDDVLSGGPEIGEAKTVEEPVSTGDSENEEMELYSREMADVNPLRDGDKLAVKEAKPKPFLPEADEDGLVMRELDDLVRGETPFDFADTDEYIEASVAGFDRRILRRLKRGEYSIQAHLDLHGLNREQARAEVAQFVRDRYKEGRRCVLIVHGRGIGSKDNIPVLKLKASNREQPVVANSDRPFSACDQGRKGEVHRPLDHGS
jgi:DNA-nicking Smr family endonuclease